MTLRSPRAWSHRSTLASAALALASATPLAACTTAATEVIIVVDTDAPARAVVMRVTASRGSALSANPASASWTRGGAGESFTLPASFGVVPGDGPRNGAVTVQVELDFVPTEAGQPRLTAQRTARFRFTERVPSFVRIFIPASCASAVVPPARCRGATATCTASAYCEEQMQTCGEEGACVSRDVVPTPIPDGGIPAVDAGTDARPDARPDVGVDARPDVGVDARPDVGVDARPDVGVDARPDVTCAPGSPCALGELCWDGAVECSTGAPVCARSAPSMAGTVCPDGACDGAGACVADFGTPQESMLTVPAGITTLRVRAWGAGGGMGRGGVNCAGGFGGYVESVLDVVPGESLRVVVGGQGQAPALFTGGAGGTPGGGGRGGNGGSQTGAGGGGFSGVFRGADALAIAGGGGGGGGSTGAVRCPGGGGGGLVGLTGGGGSARGGTQTAGGTTSGGDGARPGTYLQGGAGGGTGNDGGGGGGGGYFGGGGGQGATTDADSGGGGSGFASGAVVMLVAATPTAPGNASSPLRGTAGDRSQPGRVVLTMPGM